MYICTFIMLLTNKRNGANRLKLKNIITVLRGEPGMLRISRAKAGLGGWNFRIKRMKTLQRKKLACIINMKGGHGMRYRVQGRSGLDVRVDYVESRLDDTIKDFKESMQKSESRLDGTIKDFKHEMRQMEARHMEAVEKSEARTTEMLKDSRSARNWTIATCIAILTLVATIASGIVGQILTAIAGYQ